MARPWLFKLLRVRGGIKGSGGRKGKTVCPALVLGQEAHISLPGSPGSFVCDPRVTDKEAGAQVRQVLSPMSQLLVQRGRTAWPRPPILCLPFVCGKTLPKE